MINKKIFAMILCVMSSTSAYANEVWSIKNLTINVFTEQWGDSKKTNHPEVGLTLTIWPFHNEYRISIDIQVCEALFFVEIDPKITYGFLTGELSVEKVRLYEDWPFDIIAYGTVFLKVKTKKEKSLIEDHFKRLKKKSCRLGNV